MDYLDFASPVAGLGSKMGIDATKKLSGEGFKRAWPPLTRMREEVRWKIDVLF